jgi:hypothetical protein
MTSCRIGFRQIAAEFSHASSKPGRRADGPNLRYLDAVGIG